MNRLFLLLALALPLCAFAKEKPVYLDPVLTDIRFLGNPPLDGSAETKAEIEQLLLLQQGRTEADVARAKAEIDYDPAAFFSGVLDPAWFNSEKLPLTFTLLKAMKSDSKLVSSQGKNLWHRPRPPLQDPRLHPACDLPDSPSYPSSHATLGIAWAKVLSQAMPDLEQALMTRGNQDGNDRALLGVHFPSDVEAGKKLGVKLAGLFLTTPEFQADLAKAKAEIAAVRPVPVATTK